MEITQGIHLPKAGESSTHTNRPKNPSPVFARTQPATPDTIQFSTTTQAMYAEKTRKPTATAAGDRAALAAKKNGKPHATAADSLAALAAEKTGNPNATAADYRAALAAEKTGNLNATAADYKAALAAEKTGNPNATAADYKPALAAEKTGNPNATGADYRAALAAEKTGNPNAIASDYEKVLAVKKTGNPHATAADYGRMKYVKKTGNPNATATDYRAALAAEKTGNPNATAADYEKAKYVKKTGNPHATVADYRAALAAEKTGNPNATAADYRIALAAEKKRKFDNTITNYQTSESSQSAPNKRIASATGMSDAIKDISLNTLQKRYFPNELRPVDAESQVQERIQYEWDVIALYEVDPNTNTYRTAYERVQELLSMSQQDSEMLDALKEDLYSKPHLFATLKGVESVTIRDKGKFYPYGRFTMNGDPGHLYIRNDGVQISLSDEQVPKIDLGFIDFSRLPSDDSGYFILVDRMMDNTCQIAPHHQ